MEEEEVMQEFKKMGNAVMGIDLDVLTDEQISKIIHVIFEKEKEEKDETK